MIDDVTTLLSDPDTVAQMGEAVVQELEQIRDNLDTGLHYNDLEMFGEEAGKLTALFGKMTEWVHF